MKKLSTKINFYRHLKAELSQIFDDKITTLKETIRLKDDKSIVTAIDLAFSTFLKEEFKSNYSDKKYDFYSEEDHLDLKFPSIIVDPIDGTIELSNLFPECAVSIAIMETSQISDPQNKFFLYNPFTKLLLTDENALKLELINNEKLLGLVSKSEWKNDLFKFYSETQNLRPVGSIAYKLMLLSLGLCDYVITLKDKHIWDIAGGTILLQQKDIKLFNMHGEVKCLDNKVITGPLLWCHEKNYASLKKVFFRSE